MSNESGGIGRSILGVVAGAVVAFIGVMVIEAVGMKVYPPPPGLDPNNPESIRAMMKDIPAGALGFVLAGWVVGTLAGAAVAARIATRSPMVPAMIVGVLLLAAGVANLVMIPHPLWFTVASVVAILPAAYAGGRLGRRS
jgi:hypothetical protein